MKTSLLFLTLVLVSGVVHGAKREMDAVPSEALKIARAAGFKVIRDIDANTLKSVDPKAGALDSPSTTAAMGAGVASGILKPAPGLSSGVEAGFLFFSALLGSLPVAHPENSARVLVWMPKELATTAQAATVAMRDIWVRAIAVTLPEARVELRERETRKKKIQHYVWIDAADCSDCRLFSMTIEDGLTPNVGLAPDFLGSYEAYIWGGVGLRGNGSFAGYPWTAKQKEPAARVEFLRRLSNNLPAWMYIYVPLDKQLALYPQIFRQGKVLYFEEPGLDDPVAEESEEPAQ